MKLWLRSGREGGDREAVPQSKKDRTTLEEKHQKPDPVPHPAASATMRSASKCQFWNPESVMEPLAASVSSFGGTNPPHRFLCEPKNTEHLEQHLMPSTQQEQLSFLLPSTSKYRKPAESILLLREIPVQDTEHSHATCISYHQ